MSYNVAAAEQHRATLLLEAPFSEAELKTSYRKLIRHWHPDRYVEQPAQHAEATEKAKLINVAYEFLSEVLEQTGGVYRSPATAAAKAAWSKSDLQPKRRYEGKTYTAGFPDPSVIEIFLKRSHLVSAGYSRTTRTLYIKFSSDAVYRYFEVPEKVYEAFLNAPSHGKFANSNIYQRYRYERC